MSSNFTSPLATRYPPSLNEAAFTRNQAAYEKPKETPYKWQFSLAFLSIKNATMCD